MTASEAPFHMHPANNVHTCSWLVTCFEGIDFDDVQSEGFGVLQVLLGNVQSIAEEVVFFTCQPAKTHTKNSWSRRSYGLLPENVQERRRELLSCHQGAPLHKAAIKNE